MHAGSSWTERIRLGAVSDQPCSARLREPHGEDELAVVGVDTRAATELLGSLVDDRTKVAELAASDRDTLLASLYRGLWGDPIVATSKCEECGQSFDLSFSLFELQRQISDGRGDIRVTGPRELADRDGNLIRLPCAEQEEEAAQYGPIAGSQHLAELIAPGRNMEELGEQLEAVAPLIDVDLEASCTECGHTEITRFDIQTFTLQRLLDERERTLAEVHALAGGYGWSLAEILGLPRALRRSFAERLSGLPG